MPLERIKVTSTGGLIGTGYTNFYFGTVTPGNLTALKALLDGIKGNIPNFITYTIPNSGDTISEADGHLLGSWSTGTTQTVQGTASSATASPAGFQIRWKSATVVDGHRPVGRTMIVPASSAAFGANGALASGIASTIQGFAQTFLSATAGFAIWHRPVWDRTGPTPVLVRPGSIVSVSSTDVPLTPIVLRSRRS